MPGSRDKRPMGHIAYLRKQFKSINTNDYIKTLFKRRKSKASGVKIASSKENIDIKKLLYWKQSSVAN